MNTDAIIKDALSVVDEPAYREVPAPDRIKQGPFLVYSELPGTSDWPGFVERVSYVVEAWVPDGDPLTRLTRTKDLGEEARQALVTAWRTRRVLPGQGGINYVSNSPRATLTPSGIDGVYRVVATYDLTIRKA